MRRSLCSGMNRFFCARVVVNNTGTYFTVPFASASRRVVTRKSISCSTLSSRNFTFTTCERSCFTPATSIHISATSTVGVCSECGIFWVFGPYAHKAMKMHTQCIGVHERVTIKDETQAMQSRETLECGCFFFFPLRYCVIVVLQLPILSFIRICLYSSFICCSILFPNPSPRRLLADSIFTAPAF
jgi:hypothetical protein